MLRMLPSGSLNQAIFLLPEMYRAPWLMSHTAYRARPEPALLFGCDGPLKNRTPATMDCWKRLEFKRPEFKSKTRSAIARYGRYSAGHSTAKGTNMNTVNHISLAATTLNDPRWAAVVDRDASSDGKFLYSVKTTGVYCRPSCAARLARPENVQFHATCADAERAGFRPCKRCKPDQASLVEQHTSKVAHVCRMIEQAETVPGLDTLAAEAGLSVYHFHRVFKAITG